MSMKEELRTLKKLRQEEVRLLHATYLKTKRDVKRAISPDRMIRKHLGLSLGVAAVAGLILAPSMGGRKKKRKKAGMGSWLKSLAIKYVPGAEKFVHVEPEDAAAQAELEEQEREEADERMNGHSKKRTKGLLAKLVMEAGMLLLKRVDLSKVMSEVVQGFKRPGRAEEESPRVSVADVGTVKEEDGMGDLQ